MKLPWFKRIGILYIPQNLAGWIVILAGIIYSIYKFINIDSRSHSVSDTLRPFLINLLLIFAAYTLIAFLTGIISKNKNN
jgi:hypothetical protein